MKPSWREIIAFILLVAGMFLLLEGSKLDPLRGEIVDMGIMGAGAVMLVAYVYMMRAHLAPGRSSDMVLMPILLVLGIALLFQAITRALDVISRSLFGSLGIVLAAASAFMIYRRRTFQTSKA
ncbi:MAG: hypothetical protein QW567_00035 [Candidatus Hadarchaeales archaeon]